MMIGSIAGHHAEEEVRLHHVYVWDRVPGPSSTSGNERESESGSENVSVSMGVLLSEKK